MDPLFARVLHDQRPEGERERDRHATYPKYSMGGWMTISGYCRRGFSPLPSPEHCLHHPERLGCDIQQQQEKDLDRRDDD